MLLGIVADIVLYIKGTNITGCYNMLSSKTQKHTIIIRITPFWQEFSNSVTLFRGGRL